MQNVGAMTDRPAESSELRQRLAALEELVARQGRIEAELRGQLARWQAVVHDSPTCTLLVNRDDVIEFANRPLPGFTMADPVGRSVLDVVPAENRAALSAALHDVFQSGQERHLEIAVGTVDNTTAAYELHVRPVWLEGSVAGAALTAIDVTSRRRSEEALQREKQVLKYLLAAGDRERKLIGYEIHDGLAQQLSAAIMQLNGEVHFRRKDAAMARRSRVKAMRLLGQAMTETRRLISGSRPPMLDHAGVVAALEGLVGESNEEGGPKISFGAQVEFDRLPLLLENNIYRIVQEGLTNARRHSASPRIEVSLTQQQERLRIVIRDWGQGFDPQSARGGGFGLAGIRERARLLNGQATITSVAGQGTQIEVELPLTLPE